MQTIRTLLVLFLAGAFIGNAYNSFHAFSGTIPVTADHINPLLDWTSYLLFGFAGVAIGGLTMVLDRLFGHTAKAPGWPNVAGAMVMLGVFYFLSACIFLGNNIILLILIGGFILSVLVYDRSGIALLAALLVAIAGTTVEILLVSHKVYYYARPQIMGVAYWLPFLYGIASITTAQLARVLTEKK